MALIPSILTASIGSTLLQGSAVWVHTAWQLRSTRTTSPTDPPTPAKSHGRSAFPKRSDSRWGHNSKQKRHTGLVMIYFELFTVFTLVCRFSPSKRVQIAGCDRTRCCPMLSLWCRSDSIYGQLCLYKMDGLSKDHASLSSFKYTAIQYKLNQTEWARQVSQSNEMQELVFFLETNCFTVAFHPFFGDPATCWYSMVQPFQQPRTFSDKLLRWPAPSLATPPPASPSHGQCWQWNHPRGGKTPMFKQPLPQSHRLTSCPQSKYQTVYKCLVNLPMDIVPPICPPYT